MLTVRQNQRFIWIDSLDDPDEGRILDSQSDTFSLQYIKKLDVFHCHLGVT